MRALLILLLLLVPPVCRASDLASIAGGDQRYAACMRLVDSDPRAAYESASGWIAEGGGAPAGHCLALDLIKLGRPADAATRLGALADGLVKTEPKLVPDLYAQQAQAYQLAGDDADALTALGRALQLRPHRGDLLIDRGVLLGALGKYEEAVRDFSAAVQADPRDADALALRAAAERKLGRTGQAASDADAALALVPDHPQARLERGALRAASGDRDGARQDWLAVASGHPDSPEAARARDALAGLDVTQ